MAFSFLYVALRALLGALVGSRRGLDVKDVELLVCTTSSRFSAAGWARPKLRAADGACSRRRPATCHRPSRGARLVTPRTLLRWHRALVRREVAAAPAPPRGRPPTWGAEIRDLVIRLARENPAGAIGESAANWPNGLRVSPTTVRRLLARAGLGPAPRRSGPGWHEFLRAQAASVVACDFFSVESVLLRRYCVLFFIAHASRRVWLAGCSADPTGAWVTRPARNVGLELADEGTRLLIRDRDSKYSGTFDEVLRSGGIRIVKTPVRRRRQTPSPSGSSELVRAECLDWLLILTAATSSAYCASSSRTTTRNRPHRALKLQPPQPPEPSPTATIGKIRRHDRLGGLIPRVLPRRRQTSDTRLAPFRASVVRGTTPGNIDAGRQMSQPAAPTISAPADAPLA